MKIYSIILSSKQVLICTMLLLVVPPIASFILGYQFSGHVVTHVPTAIVDHDNSTLSQNLVNQIKRNEVFNVTNYSDNNDEVKTLIDKGTAAVGIIIPEAFSKDLIDGKAPKVLVVYDGAQMSAVGAAKGRISEILATIKTGYLINVGEGKLGIMPEVAKNNIVPISYNSRFIGNPAKTTPNFMLQGLLINITQIGMVILAIVVTNRKNYITLWIKGIFCGLIGSISMFSCIIIQIKYFAFPFRGSVTAAVILTVLFSIGMSNVGILLGLIKDDKVSIASSSMGMISATIILAGYTFPLLAMPDVFTHISKYDPFLYYGIPMRDLSLIGSTVQDVLPDIYWLGKFVVIMWIATLAVFTIKKLVKGEYKRNIVLRREYQNGISEIHK